MNGVLKGGQWEITIGGVYFRSHRKCTAVMLRARGFLQVAGQLEAGTTAESVDASRAQMEFTRATMRAAVLEPAIAPPGEPTIEGVQYRVEDLDAYADQWVVGFMKSGLEADPMPPSCEESKAPHSHEG